MVGAANGALAKVDQNKMRIAVQRTIGNVAGFHFKRNVYSIKRLFFKCSVFLKKKNN